MREWNNVKDELPSDDNEVMQLTEPTTNTSVPAVLKMTQDEYSSYMYDWMEKHTNE